MKIDNGVLHLSTALKKYPHTSKLISGDISALDVRLDCLDIEPIHRAFAPMARSQTYDVSELAIATYLQAKAYGKPLIMLPTVLAARLQQGCIVYNAQRGPMSVNDLIGARVGVRAYTQTTGMWVRAILEETYDIPTEKIDWITFEGGHLLEYKDPSFVRRAPVGKDMLTMLKSGEIDAAIFGNDLPGDDGIASLIPDPVEADRIWYAKHGFIPINHVAVMHRAVAEANPDSVKSVYKLFMQGKAAVDSPAELQKRLPDGIDALRRPMEMILAFCEKQKLLPRKLELDTIFADCIEFLGDDAH
ncbi:4,5-dihydroxyphthalate decarboxylase [Collimonas sp. OK607]|uniref:hypothetical protein n=1 Tax=Collimonas sp. OK607 TaxID=1798194 RepID=UPI0008ED2B55|nr:hypothetical protein [Collimonas sp. OK607]SFB28681.1 4,5-dihydroxyphthalate decarboxylase [Collimonas sp. OK607]